MWENDFFLLNRNKTIKELRKRVSLTSNELALKVKMDNASIASIDGKRLKEIPRELQERLIPIFRGDTHDRVH